MDAPVACPEIAVAIRKLTHAYGERYVIDNMDLQIRVGEFVALLGQSGCGKTTLLRLIAGFEPCRQGDVDAVGTLSMVFQEHRLLPWKKLWENVALGLRREQPREWAQKTLAEVGLGNRTDDWPRTLSGGESQRVALARALAQEPALLLLDEPFASLDALTRIKMQALLKELIAKVRPGVLLVTHDVSEAVLLADRILVMREGRIFKEHVVEQYVDTQQLHDDLLRELGVDVPHRQTGFLNPFSE
jgi:sulfonate transport system ATP-binding protein